jgi:hypothetical protein
MRKCLIGLALVLSVSAAFAGQKIVGGKNTTIDEPFCSG